MAARQAARPTTHKAGKSVSIKLAHRNDGSRGRFWWKLRGATALRPSVQSTGRRGVRAVGLTLEPGATLCKSYGESGLDLPGQGPSSGLKDLAAMQLQILFQLLDKSGCNIKDLRATVYARTLSEGAAGGLQLVRVASYPPASPSVIRLLSGLGSEDTILLCTEDAHTPDGRLISAEESLVQEEVVALPNSRTLVLPLAEGPLLVGMLVVDHIGQPALADAPAARPGQQQPGVLHASQQAPGTPVAAPEAPEAPAAPQALPSSSGRELVSRLNPALPLTDEQLNCIRLVAPAVGKACFMDQQAALAQLQQSAQQQVAQSLLQKAKGPLTALQTFGQMLVPRLPDGAPDKDMAQGILLQGSRLGEVVKQLEVALHPHTAMRVAGAPDALSGRPLEALADRSGGNSSSTSASMYRARLQAGEQPSSGSSSSSMDDAEAMQPGNALNSATMEAVWLTHSSGSDTEDSSAHTIDIGPVSTQQQQLPLPTPPQQQVKAPVLDLTGRPAHHQAARSAAAASATATVEGAAGVEPSACDLVDALVNVLTAAAKLARLSSILFIVNQPLQLALGSGSSNPSHGSSSNRPFRELPIDMKLGRPKLRRPQRPAAAAAPAPAAATTLEVVAHSSRAGAAGSGKLLRPVWQGTGAAASRADPAAEPQPAAVDVEAVPTAQAQAALLEQGGSSSSSSRQQAALSRQLLVAVRAQLVQRIVGYVVDIALQCTPPGGQVCVTARLDGGGVQVLVLHTGRMVPERLHSASRILAGALQRPAFLNARHERSSMGSGAATAVQPAPGSSSSPCSLTPAAAAGAVQQQRAQDAQPVQLQQQSGSASRSMLMSLELAEQLVQEVGGHMHITYPFNMVNAETGLLDVSTAVEIWLPSRLL